MNCHRGDRARLPALLADGGFAFDRDVIEALACTQADEKACRFCSHRHVNPTPAKTAPARQAVGYRDAV